VAFGFVKSNSFRKGKEMTAPAANKTPTKATPVKADNVKPAAVTESDTKPTVTNEAPKNRIPDVLSQNSILENICKRYLEVYDEISEYNKAVLAERDSEWNASKVMDKAREFARPTDAKDVKENVKAAFDAFERLAGELAKARKNVLDVTSKELGISLSAVADRDPAIEAPLKDKRKFAVEIGTQLSMLAKMTTDEAATAAVTEFLASVPLPAIGRDQTRTFGTDGKSTPKYRVTVTVSRDGNEVVKEDGFTKASLALAKHYDRGQAPKSDTLREAWEKAGNNSEKTVVDPVEFDDNGLHFLIKKK